MVCLSAAYGVCGVAGARAQELGLVKREILALYDGGQESGGANFTRIHRFAELVLNHGGFTVEFHDIRDKLPDPADVERYRAVLTWFASSVPDPDTYLAWAQEVSQKNVRYVILGDIGVAVDADNIATVNQLLALAGLRHTGGLVAPTPGTRVLQKDPDLVEFECRLDPVLPYYPVIAATGAARIGLTLELPEHERGRKTALVAVGSRGGYAALNYEFCHPQPPLYQGRWLINPFEFFRDALGTEGLPIADTTTVSGRRMYFGLLGAEGWSRPSKIEGFRDNGTTAAEVVLRELIRPFDKLPTTIDLPEDIFPKSGRSAMEARQVAQEILASPNVQKTTRHFRASRSRFDAEYPSISNLSPLSSLANSPGAPRTTNIALNAGAIYDNAQASEENGFAALKQTAANSDAPRRLKPFNLNYQAGVGERPALLQSVRQLLQLASAAPLAPVSADRYAAIVDGFFDVRVEHLGNRSWQIRNRGAVQTIRFDDAGDSDAALALSRGVIGQRHVGHVLYVALDEAVDPAIVVLDSSKRAPAGRLALEESRWLVRNVTTNPCALRFDAQGYGAGEFSWSGASSGRYSIRATRSSQELWRENAEPDAEGRLRFTVPVAGIAPVTIEATCIQSAAQ